MTHFENNENKEHLHQQKSEERREERPESRPEERRDEHKAGHNSRSQEKSYGERWSSLKGFQKFMAVTAVLQVLLLLFVAVKISGLAIPGTNQLGGSLPTQAVPSGNNDNAGNGGANLGDQTGLIDDDAVKGDPDAPVTIVEFSDYECPFCGRFYSQTLPAIIENYIDTGKVKLVYRDFPLNFHAQAQKAAEAAECAGEQGKYYEMHDQLFEDGVQGGVNAFKKYAQDIGLNTAEFNECLDSGAMAGEVAKDLADGSQAGVSGTPAFFINGKNVVGAQPYSVFEQAIEQELAKLG